MSKVKISREAELQSRAIDRRRRIWFAGTRDDGEQFLFSDSGGSSTGAASKVVTIKAAAEACGLTEDVMRERVAYRCKLTVVDGELSATQGDLQKIADAGVIPKPSDVVKATAAKTAAPDRPATDPKVDRRTNGVASALGITAEPVTPAEQTQSQAGIQRVKASDRPRRRLGQPLRWNER